MTKYNPCLGLQDFTRIQPSLCYRYETCAWTEIQKGDDVE